MSGTKPKPGKIMKLRSTQGTPRNDSFQSNINKEMTQTMNNDDKAVETILEEKQDLSPNVKNMNFNNEVTKALNSESSNSEFQKISKSKINNLKKGQNVEKRNPNHAEVQ